MSPVLQSGRKRKEEKKVGTGEYREAQTEHVNVYTRPRKSDYLIAAIKIRQSNFDLNIFNINRNTNTRESQ
jgi:hypothetical protein